jgi:hypothetical protein
MVTRKAVVRPIFWRAPHFRRRSKTSATNCARRCSALRMKEVRCGRTCRGLHHRVTKTRAKSAGRTKMTRSLSNTIDVRRRTFGVRNGGDRKIRRCKCRANRVVRFSATPGPSSIQSGRTMACEVIRSLEKLRCRSPSGCDWSTPPTLPKAKSARSGSAGHQISPNNGCC